MSPFVPIRSVPHGPRLERLRPRGLLRLAAWFMRRRMGRAMTPIFVIYTRMPRLLWPQMMMLRLAQTRLSLTSELRCLVEIHVSAQNGCTFCEDLHRATAMHDAVDPRKLADLHEFEASEAFDAREKAILRYAGEAARTGVVADETFATLRRNLSEREIVELTFLVAFVTYLNRLAVPLGIGSDGFCALARR